MSDVEEDEGSEKALKFVLLGDSEVGKTGLCCRFAQNTYPTKYVKTQGIEFYSRRIILPKGLNVLLQIWDVGGQNIANPAMLQTYLFGAHAVLFVYDVTKTSSFENLRDWIQRAKRFARQLEKPFYMGLIGNMTDLEHQRVIKIENHNKLAEEYALEPYYTSAKTGDSVDLVFKNVAASVLGVRLSKAEQEWNISIVQAHVPSNTSNYGAVLNKNNVLKINVPPSQGISTDQSISKNTINSPYNPTNNDIKNSKQTKNSAVCSIQ